MIRSILGITLVGLLVAPVALEGGGKDKKEKTYSALTSDELNKIVDGLAKKDWEPVQIRGYAKGKMSRFDCTFRYRPNAPAWYTEWDMTAARYAKAKEKRAKMRIVRESVWEVQNEKRFWAVWEDKK